MKITLDKHSLTDGVQGLEIAVKGFAGHENSQVFIEVYGGILRVHVWDGKQEDAIASVDIAAL